MAQPVKVATSTADPPLTIVSGITSPDPYYKHFAYAELQKLARSNEKNDLEYRAALFADQKYNPNMWSTLAKETLRVLGEDYQILLRRGAPPASGTFSHTRPTVRC